MPAVLGDCTDNTTAGRYSRRAGLKDLVLESFQTMHLFIKCANRGEPVLKDHAIAIKSNLSREVVYGDGFS